jgi:hypothetical protein
VRVVRHSFRSVSNSEDWVDLPQKVAIVAIKKLLVGFVCLGLS